VLVLLGRTPELGSIHRKTLIISIVTPNVAEYYLTFIRRALGSVSSYRLFCPPDFSITERSHFGISLESECSTIYYLCKTADEGRVPSTIRAVIPACMFQPFAVHINDIQGKILPNKCEKRHGYKHERVRRKIEVAPSWSEARGAA
jgi:hypothetical protein